MPWRIETQPDTDWKNIFQLWDENGRRLPFKVAKQTWSAEAGHYLVVERIEIGNWPYGKAWGQYHWNGVPGAPAEKVNQPGTYTWCKVL